MAKKKKTQKNRPIESYEHKDKQRVIQSFLHRRQEAQGAERRKGAQQS